MDVDGTLTDGKIYMGANGECFKAFDIKDGYALHTLLKENGIIPIIITARKSQIVELRCKELGVTEIHQGVMQKLDCLKGILEKYRDENEIYTLTNCAYIGDDLLDIQCMDPIIKAGGVAGCPKDAVQSVIDICDFVSFHESGDGAVRDFVEYIINRNRDKDVRIDKKINSRIDWGIEFISKLDFSSLKIGKYEVSPDFYYTVQEYVPFGEKELQYESHRKYIDIQWVYEGTVKLLISDAHKMSPSDDYDKDKDVIHYHDTDIQTTIILSEGSCAVLFPKDAHKVTQFIGQNAKIKKVVGKLLVEYKFVTN